MSVNERIRHKIEELGLTQQEVADAINKEALKDGITLNYSNSTISNWVTNRSKPDIDILTYICKALNVDANYIYRFEEKKKEKDLKEQLKIALNDNGFSTDKDIDKLMAFIEKNKTFLSKDNEDPSIEAIIDFVITNKDFFK